MASFPGCKACPFAADPGTPCAAVQTGHRAFCRAIDPEDPDHDPRMACAVRRLTLELLGHTLPAEDVEARRAAKPRVNLGERPPAKPGSD